MHPTAAPRAGNESGRARTLGRCDAFLFLVVLLVGVSATLSSLCGRPMVRLQKYTIRKAYTTLLKEFNLGKVSNAIHTLHNSWYERSRTIHEVFNYTNLPSQVLMGDKISASPYELSMGEDTFCALLCKQTMSEVRSCPCQTEHENAPVLLLSISSLTNSIHASEKGPRKLRAAHNLINLWKAFRSRLLPTSYNSTLRFTALHV